MPPLRSSALRNILYLLILMRPGYAESRPTPPLKFVSQSVLGVKEDVFKVPVGVVAEGDMDRVAVRPSWC